MKRARRVLVSVSLLVALLAVGTLSASADQYEPRRSAHPLRMVAYLLHPVGVIFDTLIFRPAHWIGTREPFKTFFGHRDDDL